MHLLCLVIRLGRIRLSYLDIIKLLALVDYYVFYYQFILI